MNINRFHSTKFSSIEGHGHSNTRNGAISGTSVRITIKLDQGSLRHWAEDQKGNTDIRSLEDFERFMNMRINILEGIITQSKIDTTSSKTIQLHLVLILKHHVFGTTKRRIQKFLINILLQMTLARFGLIELNG